MCTTKGKFWFFFLKVVLKCFITVPGKGLRFYFSFFALKGGNLRQSLVDKSEQFSLYTLYECLSFNVVVGDRLSRFSDVLQGVYYCFFNYLFYIAGHIRCILFFAFYFLSERVVRSSPCRCCMNELMFCNNWVLLAEKLSGNPFGWKKNVWFFLTGMAIQFMRVQRWWSLSADFKRGGSRIEGGNMLMPQKHCVCFWLTVIEGLLSWMDMVRANRCHRLKLWFVFCLMVHLNWPRTGSLSRTERQHPPSDNGQTESIVTPGLHPLTIIWVLFAWVLLCPSGMWWIFLPWFFFQNCFLLVRFGFLKKLKSCVKLVWVARVWVSNAFGLWEGESVGRTVNYPSNPWEVAYIFDARSE